MALPLGLLFLLVALAWLQYRWTGELSRAESVRLKSNLDSSLARFSEDFDEEIARVFRGFAVRSPAEELPEALAEWRGDAPYPELVDEVFTVENNREHQGLALLKLSAEGTFEPAAWPDGLSGIREQFERFGHSRPQWAGRPPPLTLVSHDPLGLVVPFFRERRRLDANVPLAALITLNHSVLQEQILPDLVSRHFESSQEPTYDVVVLDQKGDVSFASREDIAAAVVRTPDASTRIFSLRRGSRPRAQPLEAHYEVFVRHRAGSLEAALASVRRRNLAVGLGILLVLGVSIVLVTTSARRAMELSERKMEFVAGVSHELRTPLSVIRSAAQNLTDGAVSSAEQVKTYGALVEAESRRLQDLVEQVLELAGVQSQRRSYRRDPVSTRELVAEARADSETAAKERGVPIETSLAQGDLSVLGEREALRRALSNLIANAIKHGGDDNVVSVDVSSRDGFVSLAVSDRGPGIKDSDLPHLFEPFYRGSRAKDQQTRGSGLGLSLVDHIAKEHGGRVDVSTSRRGSRFALVLPEARDSAEKD